MTKNVIKSNTYYMKITLLVMDHEWSLSIIILGQEQSHKENLILYFYPKL